MINLIKALPFLQNLVTWMTSLVSPIVVHNLGKYFAIKRAFYLTGLERLEGDYFEFGMFTGSSFVCAMREHRRCSKLFGKIDTRFFGFDSFSGFGKVVEEDEHPFYIDSIFKVDKEKVIRNIKKHSYSYDFSIIEGFFEDSIKGKMSKDLLDSHLARIVFIDCDLMEPAKICFDFVAPILQQGTILIMDDFFSYKGDSALGLAGAFAYFNGKYPEMKWRHLFNYGSLGSVYILSSIEK